MSIIAFLIGCGLTTAIGWLALGLAEGKTPVLSRAERLVWGVILGPTLSMFVVFVCHVIGLVKLDLIGFLIPQLLLLLVFAGASWKLGSLRFAGATNVTAPSKTYPRWMTIGIFILCAWTAVKLVAGGYDLLGVPTYWDDSFNNWNMRAKMFVETQELTLEIPIGNGVVADAQGVSSYPPMLPLMKTWLTVLRGRWSEPLVNGVHLVWGIGLLAALYLTLRRRFDPLLSSFGVYLLVSLPLVIIHINNPYAEIFVASHLFLAVAALVGLRGATTGTGVQSWTRLFFLALGLLILTKNEALLLHAPLLFLAAVAFDIRRKHLVSWSEHRNTIAIGFGILLSLVVPWLAFKWFNGLTFGNAKSVGGTQLAFNPVVVQALWFHFTHEANWLILPLTLILGFIAAGRRFWRSREAWLGAFVLTNIAAQMALFVFIPALGTEAIRQTGVSRGLLQIMPAVILLCLILLKNRRTES